MRQDIRALTTSSLSMGAVASPAMLHVSINRFLVPKSEEAQFEQSWAQRKCRLADAGGFRYFQMGKRAADFMGPPLPEDEPNYVSYCVFDSHADFVAFEHTLEEGGWGGDSAAYDGLFTLSLAPESPPEVVDGWRAVDEGDLSDKLPREAFVASNRFGIKPGYEGEFEAMWAKRGSSLAEL